MMASFMFDNDYFMYGLETFAESNNTDMFEYMEKILVLMNLRRSN